MDAIRKRQIAEVLDEDKILGAMVIDLERRWISTLDENPLPYTQLNEEVLDATTSNVSSLLVLL